MERKNKRKKVIRKQNVRWQVWAVFENQIKKDQWHFKFN